VLELSETVIRQVFTVSYQWHSQPMDRQARWLQSRPRYHGFFRPQEASQLRRQKSEQIRVYDRTKIHRESTYRSKSKS
jgi:hypothetical protein